MQALPENACTPGVLMFRHEMGQTFWKSTNFLCLTAQSSTYPFKFGTLFAGRMIGIWLCVLKLTIKHQLLQHPPSAD